MTMIYEIIDKINEELDKHNIEIVDDNEEHDGFCVFEVNEIK